MRTIEGEVIVRECDFSDWYFTYGDVSSDKEELTEILEEYKGKKVRVTIEVIEYPHEHSIEKLGGYDSFRK